MPKSLGVQAHSEYRTGGLFSRLLWKIAVNTPSEPRVRTQEKKVDGRKAAAREMLPDADVAVIRWLYEQEGMRPKAIAARFGLTPLRVSNLVAYKTRADVEPAPPQPAHSGLVGADPSINSLACHEAKSLFFAER